MLWLHNNDTLMEWDNLWVRLATKHSHYLMPHFHCIALILSEKNNAAIFCRLQILCTYTAYLAYRLCYKQTHNASSKRSNKKMYFFICVLWALLYLELSTHNTFKLQRSPTSCWNPFIIRCNVNSFYFLNYQDLKKLNIVFMSCQPWPITGLMIIQKFTSQANIVLVNIKYFLYMDQRWWNHWC